MSFVDKAEVTFLAGDGGNGVISFRHEKYIDKGGPDGGNGGRGGDIILKATNNQNTLSDFRFNKLIKAKSGNPGGKRKKNGRGGEDMFVSVPLGTSVINDYGQLIVDLVKEGDETIIAKGGRGGFGNSHFLSSTRQAPRIAEKGEAGQKIHVVLELKMIAEVGLVGLPNAGKSTLLSVLSNARPEIADYPFTTLTPNLGVALISKNQKLLVADIPGLIEGAAVGKGLGDEFLRHVERTLVLVHLIDVASNNIIEDYSTIQNELKSYKVDLSIRPQIVALTKIDTVSDKVLNRQKQILSKHLKNRVSIFPISSITNSGIDKLIIDINKIVAAEKLKLSKIKQKIDESLPTLTLPIDDNTWNIAKSKKGYLLTGKNIERFAAQTDLNNPDAEKRLRDIMKRNGIIHELIRSGIKKGDAIIIGDKLTIIY